MTLDTLTIEQKQYCISARERVSGITESITGPMSKNEADAWRPSTFDKKIYVYFKVSAYPFKRHKKGGR